MKVILLKDVQRPGGKVLKAGRNVSCSLAYGSGLIGKKLAGEIPEYLNGEFHMFGEPSRKLLTLRRTDEQPDVTIEEYNRVVKPIKEKTYNA